MSQKPKSNVMKKGDQPDKNNKKEEEAKKNNFSDDKLNLEEVAKRFEISANVMEEVETYFDDILSAPKEEKTRDKIKKAEYNSTYYFKNSKAKIIKSEAYSYIKNLQNYELDSLYIRAKYFFEKKESILNYFNGDNEETIKRLFSDAIYREKKKRILVYEKVTGKKLTEATKQKYFQLRFNPNDLEINKIFKAIPKEKPEKNLDIQQVKVGKRPQLHQANFANKRQRVNEVEEEKKNENIDDDREDKKKQDSVQEVEQYSVANQNDQDINDNEEEVDGNYEANQEVNDHQELEDVQEDLNQYNLNMNATSEIQRKSLERQMSLKFNPTDVLSMFSDTSPKEILQENQATSKGQSTKQGGFRIKTRGNISLCNKAMVQVESESSHQSTYLQGRKNVNFSLTSKDRKQEEKVQEVKEEGESSWEEQDSNSLEEEKAEHTKESKPSKDYSLSPDSKKKLLDAIHKRNIVTDLYEQLDVDIDYSNNQILSRLRVASKNANQQAKRKENQVEHIDTNSHSFTYGELTQDSMDKIIIRMQNLGTEVKEQNIPKLKRWDRFCQIYNLGKDSIFLDIGSGLGRPVFHAAIATDCLSFGLELQPQRIKGSYLLFQSLFPHLSNKIPAGDTSLSNVAFYHINAALLGEYCSFIPSRGSYFYSIEPTHIFSYNRCISVEDMKDIAQALCQIDFKVLVWSLNQKDTLRLLNKARGYIQYLGKQKVNTKVAQQKFTMYVYFRIPTNYKEQNKMIHKKSYWKQLRAFKEERKCINLARYMRLIQGISPQLQSMTKSSIDALDLSPHREEYAKSKWLPKAFGNSIHSSVLIGHDFQRAKTTTEKIALYQKIQLYVHSLESQFPHYQFQRRIASSVTGYVLKAIKDPLDENEPYEEFAIKIFSDEHHFEAKDEADILQKFQDSTCFNIIKFVNVIQACEEISNDISLFIIFPYYYINLKDALKERWSKDFNVIRHLFAGIVRGVHKIHNQDIAHCDLKLSNIVISEYLNPYIIDFGHAQQCKGRLISKGTLEYQAPELKVWFGNQDIHHDYRRSDCWSLGIILFQMLFGKFPFDYTTKFKEIVESYPSKQTYEEFSLKFFELDLSSHLLKIKYSILQEPLITNALELIRSLLQQEPSKRPDINMIKKYNWVADLFQFDGDYEKTYNSFSSDIRKSFEKSLKEFKECEQQLIEKPMIEEAKKALEKKSLEKNVTKYLQRTDTRKLKVKNKHLIKRGRKPILKTDQDQDSN